MPRLRLTTRPQRKYLNFFKSSLLLSWVLLILCPFTGWTQQEPLVTFGEGNERLKLGKVAYIFVDSSASIPLDQVMSDQYHSHFSVGTSDYANFGFTKSVVWLKFFVQSKYDVPQVLRLHLGPSHLDNIKYYHKVGNEELKMIESGDLFPFDNRQINNRDFFFYTPLEPGKVTTVYVRYQTKGNLRISPTLYTAEEKADVDLKSNIGIGIYYGILIVMLFYNLILYLFVKESSYLYYVIYIFSYGFFQMGWMGLGYQFVWGDSSWVQKHAIVFFTCMWIFWLILFTKKFLKTSKTAPRISKALNAVNAFNGVVLVLLFVSRELSFTLGPLLGIITSCMILYAAVVCLRKGYRPARYFLIALFFFLLSSFVTSLTLMKVIPLTFVSEHALQFGSAMEMILLSLALGDRLNLMRRDKIKAQQREVENLQKINRMKDELNEELEQKVQERTSEISEQKRIIEHNAKEILQSINYARRIQNSILPSLDEIKRDFREFFIFYKPKDVVSGDFYWHYNLEGRKIFAVVDCTGHGVPGAFMAAIGSNLLHKIVVENKQYQPAKILSELNHGVITFLKQNTDEENVQDGMDLAICVFDELGKKMTYAGAKRSIYLVENRELKELKADTRSVGGTHNDPEPYTEQEVMLKGNETIYLTTDGYADQFGGPSNRKFMRQRLRELVLEISEMDMATQRKRLEDAHMAWKGDTEQIDDILVAGIRVGSLSIN